MTQAPFGMTYEQARVAWAALQQFVDNQVEYDPEYDEPPSEGELAQANAAQGMIDQFDTYFAGLGSPEKG